LTCQYIIWLNYYIELGCTLSGTQTTRDIVAKQYGNRYTYRMPTKKQLYDRQWYRKNTKYKTEYVRAWREKTKNVPEVKYKKYEKSAKNRNLVFELTYASFLSLISLPCSYCGFYNVDMGIDRVNNLEGYILSNCTPCCHVCNYMKRAYNKDFFLAHCKKICNFNI